MVKPVKTVKPILFLRVTPKGSRVVHLNALAADLGGKRVTAPALSAKADGMGCG